MVVSEEIMITDVMVNTFSEVSGDKNPIHINEELASKSIFGKKIAHGSLIISFFSRLISEKFPGHGSIYLSQTVNFLKPCFVNEFVIIEVSLIKKEGDKYFLSTVALNKKNETLVSGEAIILKK